MTRRSLVRSVLPVLSAALVVSCNLFPANPRVDPNRSGALTLMTVPPLSNQADRSFYTHAAIYSGTGQLLYELSAGSNSCFFQYLNAGEYVVEYYVKRYGAFVNGSTRRMALSVAVGDVVSLRVRATGAGLISIDRDTARTTQQDVARLGYLLHNGAPCRDVVPARLYPAG